MATINFKITDTAEHGVKISVEEIDGPSGPEDTSYLIAMMFIKILQDADDLISEENVRMH